MARREFQLVEGTSKKFWAITLDGVAHEVHFGRIGTSGQAVRKEFGSEAEAKTAHDKLVAEKVKKGYVEVGAVETAVPASPPPARPSAKKAQAESAEAPPAETETPAGVEPAPVAAEAAARAVADIAAERVIDLTPQEWLWATWRPRSPLPRPEPAPFDFQAAVEKLAKVKASHWAWEAEWDDMPLPPSLSREEAHFWFYAMTAASHELKPQQLAARLEATPRSFDGELTSKAFKELGKVGSSNYVPPRVVLPLVVLLGPEGFLDAVAALEGARQRSWGSAISPERIAGAFRRDVLPYLTDPEREEFRALVRARLDPPALPGVYYDAFRVNWYLAAALGMHAEVMSLLAVIPDDHYQKKEEHYDYYQRPQLLVLGLGDPSLVESEWRRLDLRHKTPSDVTGWLANTEWHALDRVRDSILEQRNKDTCAGLLREFARVQAPEAAGPMLELLLDSKAPKLARRWLDENVGHAILGLVGASGGRGKLADAALEFLRDQKRRGQEDAIRAATAAVPAEAAERVRREVLDRVEVVVLPLDAETTPAPLAEGLAQASKLKVPAWIDEASLPPVVVGDRQLAPAQRRALVAALAKSTLAEPHPAVTALRAQADRRSLDLFAWALFEKWLIEGAPSKEKWGMSTLGLLGGDGAALKLTPLVRNWPGESQHQRAVHGLECLRAIGTDVALMQLNGIAQKISFKGLKAKAVEFMEAIAEDRGLTRAQLEDRIVPDCDLDERGTRIFDFGPRQFKFVLGPEMKPMVRDPDGKLKPDLPKPGARDDAAQANAAVDAWKLLKKQLKEVVKVQAERLEQAMVTGRRWSPDDFQTLIVRHPLMTNLARLLLWGGYDASGNLVRTFRVTEERDFADVHDDAATLDGLATVGVVHPLHLPPEVSSAWGEVLGDYEIIPPFPQLGRPVHRLEPGEESARELVRNKGMKYPAVTLVGILDRHGWARGIPEDAGVFHEHSKAFEGANVTAILEYEGIPIGGMIDWDDQEIERCFFLRGIYTPKMYPDHGKALRLGEVDPVVISEVLGTLGALASKGK